jgi:hypothetical protein
MVFLAMPSGPAAWLQSMRLDRAALQAAEAEAEAGAARQSMALMDDVLVRPRQIAPMRCRAPLPGWLGAPACGFLGRCAESRSRLAPLSFHNCSFQQTIDLQRVRYAPRLAYKTI